MKLEVVITVGLLALAVTVAWIVLTPNHLFVG